jgi:hypothetical protein
MSGFKQCAYRTGRREQTIGLQRVAYMHWYWVVVVVAVAMPTNLATSCIPRILRSLPVISSSLYVLPTRVH